MQLLHGLEALGSLPEVGAASIGNFDGIHAGHAQILRQARELAAGKAVCVITFEPHPLTVLRPEHAPPRLTDVQSKRALLGDIGVDYLIEIAPTPQVLDVTAEEFWEMVRDGLKPSHLIEGSDFHFGRGRAGNISVLQRWSSESTVQLHVLPSVEATLLNLHVVPISSSLIRWLVGNGRMRDAKTCLGRPYALRGEVIEGFGRGHELQMPTANLRITDQVIPMEGIYSGRCAVNGKIYSAAISVGMPPTFDQAAFQIEAHLVGYSGNLYGQILNLEFLDWLRDQRKFSDTAALRKQMHRDLELIGSTL